MTKQIFIFAIILLFLGCNDDENISKCKYPIKVEIYTGYSNDAQPVNQEYDYKAMNCVLNYAKALNKFPAVEFELNEDIIVPDNEITEFDATKIRVLFDKVQDYYFKRNLVGLVFTLGDNGFSAEYSVNKIHAGVESIKAILNEAKYENPLNVMKFILAHELVHFIHEVSTNKPVTSLLKYSVNGNYSIYSLENGGFTKDIPDFETFLRNYYRSHSEIDALATLALINNNDLNWWNDAIINLKLGIEKTEAKNKKFGEQESTIDFESRINSITKTVTFLGY